LCQYNAAAKLALDCRKAVVEQGSLDGSACPQKCVELLRKQKLGVATFLILEKQQHLAAQMSKAASPPEGERFGFRDECGPYLLPCDVVGKRSRHGHSAHHRPRSLPL